MPQTKHTADGYLNNKKHQTKLLLPKYRSLSIYIIIHTSKFKEPKKPQTIYLSTYGPSLFFFFLLLGAGRGSKAAGEAVQEGGRASAADAAAGLQGGPHQLPGCRSEANCPA